MGDINLHNLATQYTDQGEQGAGQKLKRAKGLFTTGKWLNHDKVNQELNRILDNKSIVWNFKKEDFSDVEKIIDKLASSSLSLEEVEKTKDHIKNVKSELLKKIPIIQKRTNEAKPDGEKIPVDFKLTISKDEIFQAINNLGLDPENDIELLRDIICNWKSQLLVADKITKDIQLNDDNSITVTVKNSSLDQNLEAIKSKVEDYAKNCFEKQAETSENEFLTIEWNLDEVFSEEVLGQLENTNEMKEYLAKKILPEISNRRENPNKEINRFMQKYRNSADHMDVLFLKVPKGITREALKKHGLEVVNTLMGGRCVKAVNHDDKLEKLQKTQAQYFLTNEYIESSSQKMLEEFRIQITTDFIDFYQLPETKCLNNPNLDLFFQVHNELLIKEKYNKFGLRADHWDDEKGGFRYENIANILEVTKNSEDPFDQIIRKFALNIQEKCDQAFDLIFEKLQSQFDELEKDDSKLFFIPKNIPMDDEMKKLIDPHHQSFLDCWFFARLWGSNQLFREKLFGKGFGIPTNLGRIWRLDHFVTYEGFHGTAETGPFKIPEEKTYYSKGEASSISLGELSLPSEEVEIKNSHLKGLIEALRTDKTRAIDILPKGKVSYANLSLLLHPDKYKGKAEIHEILSKDEATNLFRIVQEAYERLKS